jgi:hypothetical protein
MKMAAKQNVSIVSLLESRRIHGTPFSLTIKRKRFSPMLHFHLRTVINKQRVIAVLKKKETLACCENKKQFYRRLRTAMVSGSLRFLPQKVVPAPSEDGEHTNFVVMSTYGWNASSIIGFA